jgi:hypothetical protein
MGEAKRRKLAGDHPDSGNTTTNTLGAVLMDHVWPGNEDKIKAKARAGDKRSKYVWNALALVVHEIAQRTKTCSECDTAITTLNDLGCCSVAQVIAAKPVAIGIPFCRSCVTDRGKVAVMAHAAAERALRRTIERDSRIEDHA